MAPDAFEVRDRGETSKAVSELGPAATCIAEFKARLGAILRRVVSERRIGVLLVEHDLSLVLDVCEYLYVVDFGELIFEGTPTQVVNSQRVRDAYLGDGFDEDVIGTRAQLPELP